MFPAILSGMASSLLMGGIRSLLGGDQQQLGQMAGQVSPVGMLMGKAPQLPGLANFPGFADGGIMDMPPIPPGEDMSMAYAMDRGGMIRGPGGGVDDLIGGSIDNRQKVLLSDGEFVIPARVVSALGDGSSEAGARVLHDMIDRVKAEGSERIMDNGDIDHNRVMPA
jgi:hypothetical protein